MLLSNIIFSIKVIHNDASLRKLIINELKDNGITMYRPFVSYDKKEQILDKIRKKHKDRIEWIEMTRNGVKYIVNVEERIDKSIKEDNKYQNIIASKKGIIKKIQAKDGEVVKIVVVLVD